MAFTKKLLALLLIVVMAIGTLTGCVPSDSGSGSASSTAAIAEDGSYTSKEDVALYLHTYGHLPDNYMTKDEAGRLAGKAKAPWMRWHRANPSAVITLAIMRASCLTSLDASTMSATSIMFQAIATPSALSTQTTAIFTTQKTITIRLNTCMEMMKNERNDHRFQPISQRGSVS